MNSIFDVKGSKKMNEDLATVVEMLDDLGGINTVAEALGISEDRLAMFINQWIDLDLKTKDTEQLRIDLAQEKKRALLLQKALDNALKELQKKDSKCLLIVATSSALLKIALDNWADLAIYHDIAADDGDFKGNMYIEGSNGIQYSFMDLENPQLWASALIRIIDQKIQKKDSTIYINLTRLRKNPFVYEGYIDFSYPLQIKRLYPEKRDCK